MNRGGHGHSSDLRHSGSGGNLRRIHRSIKEKAVPDGSAAGKHTDQTILNCEINSRSLPLCRLSHHFLSRKRHIHTHIHSAHTSAIPRTKHHGPPLRNGQLFVRHHPPQQQLPSFNNTEPLVEYALTAALATMSPTTPSRTLCSRTPQTPTGTTSTRCQSTMSISTTSSACGLRGTRTSATMRLPPVS